MDVETFVFEFHSGWRYLVILTVVLAVIDTLWGIAAKRSWSSLDRRIGLAAIITVSIQWLIGIVLWIVLYVPNLDNLTPSIRGFVEHPVNMTIGVAVMHILWARARKAEPSAVKFRLAFFAFVLSGALIGLGIWRMTLG